MRCPVCKNTKREIAHHNLVDNTFRVASGKWSLWKCNNCNCAYLDPRPSQNSLYRAYLNYYTHHSATEVKNKRLSTFGKIRLRLLNGYSNWRYGTHALPASRLGIYAIHTMPNRKERLDNRFRHIPRITKERKTLLDVGCGDGAFLKTAKSCGWDVIGLDPDVKAVHNAIQSGLNIIQGGIEIYEGQINLFDAITLSHVIEHVQDPIGLLKACHALLKPGGQLWLETPNIDSYGHHFFKKNWRGLESPRHLILFNRDSLKLAFHSAGFFDIRNISRTNLAINLYRSSFAIETEKSPNTTIHKIPRTIQLKAKEADILSRLFPSRREFLTVLAWK